MAIFITVLLWFGILSPQQPATGKGKEALKKYEAQQNEQTQDCAPVTVQCCPQAQNSKAKSDDSDAESKSVFDLWPVRSCSDHRNSDLGMATDSRDETNRASLVGRHNRTAAHYGEGQGPQLV